MKILKSIRLNNFQSHRNTLINLSGLGNLTVITGPSDSGKSSIIRALRLVYYNVPQGIGFIFNAEDRCSVLLTYEDGTTVERIRSRGGINRYVVNGQTLEGFGTGVPLEVQQATGIRKLEIGDQSFLLNLSEQLDGPFLGKSVSGPARAKVLGKLAGTEEIDYAGKQVGTDLYRANRMQEVLEKNIELLQADIEEFHWIYPRDRAVTSAETLLADTRSKVAHISKLRELARQWQESSDKVMVLKKVVNGLQEVDKGLDLVRTAQDELTRVRTLVMDLSLYYGAFHGADRDRSTLNILDLVIRIASPMIEMIVEKSTKISVCTSFYDRYDDSSISVLTLRKATQRLSDIGNVVDHLVMASNYNAMVSSLEDIHSRYEGSRLSILSLSGVVKMFTNIGQAGEHLAKVFSYNVQQSTIKVLADLCERSSSSALSFRRLVQNLSNIEDSFIYISKVITNKSLKTTLSGLKDNYYSLNLSSVTQNKSLNRLIGIDLVTDHLDQAFTDNLRKLGIVEAKERRLSFAQNVTHSLQSFGELTQDLNVAESDYLSLMSSLGQCPTCGNEIDVQKLKEVI